MIRNIFKVKKFCVSILLSVRIDLANLYMARFITINANIVNIPVEATFYN